MGRDSYLQRIGYFDLRKWGSFDMERNGGVSNLRRVRSLTRELFIGS